MNKVKDFFYDKNDILVALIVLLLAAVIVFWRVSVIMNYPEKMVALASENANKVNSSQDADPSTTGGAVTPQDGESDQPVHTGADDVEICAVYVNYGESLEVIAQNCMAAGLIDSVDEFISVVNSLGAASSIQSGQHHIPSDATPEELVQYLLQPGL